MSARVFASLACATALASWCGCSSSGLGRASGGGAPATIPAAGAAGHATAGAAPGGSPNIDGMAGAGASSGSSGHGGSPSGAPGAGGGPAGAGQGGSSVDVTASWEQWSGWNGRCPLRVPGEKGALPAPIEWEPCGAPFPGSGCRQMKTSWTSQPAAAFPTTVPTMGRTEDGKLLLEFMRRNVDDDPAKNLMLVAEVDGPVRSALLEGAYDATCDYTWGGTNGNHYAWYEPNDVAGLADDAVRSEGFIGGVLDERTPSLDEVLQHPGAVGPIYLAGPSYMARALSFTEVQAWGTSAWLRAYDPDLDPSPAPINWVVMQGEDVFTELGESTNRGVAVWSKAQGQRRLLIDPTQKSDRRAFATDGKDMVWDQGESDLDPDLGIYNGGAVMTAPYTTDPDVVVATTRRVRTDESLIGGHRFQLGCGYAARTTSAGPLNDGVTVVRLADGRAWQLPGMPIGADFAYAEVLAVTCDEVFVYGGGKALGAAGQLDVVRLRLDSLGDGVPSDIGSNGSAMTSKPGPSSRRAKR